jgi:hypothetical protein
MKAPVDKTIQLHRSLHGTALHTKTLPSLGLEIDPIELLEKNAPADPETATVFSHSSGPKNPRLKDDIYNSRMQACRESLAAEYLKKLSVQSEKFRQRWPVFRNWANRMNLGPSCPLSKAPRPPARENFERLQWTTVISRKERFVSILMCETLSMPHEEARSVEKALRKLHDVLDRTDSGSVDYREFLCLLNIVEVPEMPIRKRLKLWFDIYMSTTVMGGITVSELLRLLASASLNDSEHYQVIDLAITAMQNTIQTSEAALDPTLRCCITRQPPGKGALKGVQFLKDIDFLAMDQVRPPTLPTSLILASKYREVGAVAITEPAFIDFLSSAAQDAQILIEQIEKQCRKRLSSDERCRIMNKTCETIFVRFSKAEYRCILRRAITKFQSCEFKKCFRRWKWWWSFRKKCRVANEHFRQKKLRGFSIWHAHIKRRLNLWGLQKSADAWRRWRLKYDVFRAWRGYVSSQFIICRMGSSLLTNILYRGSLYEMFTKLALHLKTAKDERERQLQTAVALWRDIQNRFVPRVFNALKQYATDQKHDREALARQDHIWSRLQGGTEEWAASSLQRAWRGKQGRLHFLDCVWKAREYEKEMAAKTHAYHTNKIVQAQNNGRLKNKAKVEKARVAKRNSFWEKMEMEAVIQARKDAVDWLLTEEGKECIEKEAMWIYEEDPKDAAKRGFEGRFVKKCDWSLLQEGFGGQYAQAFFFNELTGQKVMCEELTKKDCTEIAKSTLIAAR